MTSPTAPCSTRSCAGWPVRLAERVSRATGRRPAPSRRRCAIRTSRSEADRRHCRSGVDDAERIGELACALLDRALADRPGALRLVGVGVSNLEPYRQLVLA